MTATNDTLIEVDDVSLKFDARAGVEHVNLTINRGEIVTLIGPNGAGKSTLARLVLGILSPDTGSVRKKPGVKIGYVPQKISADPILPITVSRFLRMAVDSNQADVSQTLAEVGAGTVIDQELDELSGGELQRVYLARALLRDPDLLVLDEPTQNVDYTGQAELHALIGSIRDKRGCGILVVSHDLHLVMSSTDRVLCLNHHVCCEGQPEAVSQHPEYLSLFGAKIAAGLAVYSHQHDHHHDLSGEVAHDCGDHSHHHHTTHDR